MNQIERINTFLRTKGYDLRELNGYDLTKADVVNRGLTKQEAMDVIEYIQQVGVGISGGDVYYLDGEGKIGLTYDNWYYNCIKGESDAEYLERSIAFAKKYINEYKNKSFNNCIFLFDIVLDRGGRNIHH
jgi:hypothetical protein